MANGARLRTSSRRGSQVQILAPALLPRTRRAIGVAVAIAVALGVLTKGWIFVCLPKLLTRGQFGGERSEGGGAKGRY